ncbi:MAG TPA: hypothetical protein VLG38_00720 [Gammaproteobacteria bacterium]|nr:hypothetical protein [Gammaproteobacteria bacterium]
MPVTKTISIATFAPDRTLGDVSAAYKLIEGLLAANATDTELDLKINWFVRIYDLDNEGHFKIFENFFAAARKLGVKMDVMHNFDQRPNYRISDALENMEPSTDLFLAFPIYRDFADAKTIIIRNKPLLVFNEYNPPKTSAYALSHEIFRTCIKTGLGLQKIGIFIEPSIPKAHEKEYETTEHDRNVINTLGLNNPQYSAQRALYFSYFNRSLNVNPTVSKKSFCVLSLLVQARKQRKDVDLIVRLDGLTIRAESPPADACDFFTADEIGLISPFYSQINVIDANGNILETRTLNADSTLPKVRIIDPFPLSTEGFKLVLSYAQPFAGATGNESFAECISNTNLMFYQIMGWKQSLFGEFLELCKKYTHSESELVKFYGYQKHCTSHFDEFKHYVEEMAKIIVDQEAVLVKQMAKVKQGILTEFNLAANLVPRLRRAVMHLEEIPELFKRYALSAHGINISTPEYMLKPLAQHTQPVAASQFTNSQSLEEFRIQFRNQRAQASAQQTFATSARQESSASPSQSSHNSSQDLRSYASQSSASYSDQESQDDASKVSKNNNKRAKFVG